MDPCEASTSNPIIAATSNPIDIRNSKYIKDTRIKTNTPETDDLTFNSPGTLQSNFFKTLEEGILKSRQRIKTPFPKGFRTIPINENPIPDAGYTEEIIYHTRSNKTPQNPEQSKQSENQEGKN